MVEQQRLAIADLLDGLTPQQWESPSLCAGWRIRDVAAHVTLVGLPPSAGSIFTDMVRSHGNFHRLNTAAAKRRAQRPQRQLIADLRACASSRKVPIVSSHRNVLFDVAVHGQDIAIPLGLELSIPPAAAAEAATRVWTMGWPFWASRRLSGLRLTATDADWSAGSGSDVHGPIRALLLLLTGRTTTAADMLAGDGVAQLRRRT
ncbi:MAG TPA: maleylpyruvate isomerase family mycothiol-dependent enzyme [Micromonosporaceae bacterium]|nr:maleylpyruvate isomerase family mycothiol-dependent enzyme [Micromonosporaceae bacterium]